MSARENSLPQPAKIVVAGNRFSENGVMNAEDGRPITITQDDISEANRLSLHCPICAGAVEQHVDGAAVRPVVCTSCGTLYHRACWDQNGGKCAILGCESQSYRIYGMLDLGPTLKISQRDILAAPPPPAQPRPVAPPNNGQTKTLKRKEQQLHQEVQRRFWLRDLFQNLLRAIRIWPSDPS
jgi:hypothetical protein